MRVIFGNYGDNTIALIEWAHQAGLTDLTIAHVQTGSEATRWHERVKEGQALANRYHFSTMTLYPSRSFAELVRDRGTFPNAKYQWCPTFLKALPLLSWLDEVDAECEAVILLGSRRQDSRSRSKLPERIISSEHYGGRRVEYPLCLISQQGRDTLIAQAGFEVLNRRSLECDPCIHSHPAELALLDAASLARIEALEKDLSSQTMFHLQIAEVVERAKFTNNENLISPLEKFDLGCGAFFVCGE